MVLGISGLMKAKLEGKGLPKRMAGVEQALKKMKK